MSCFVFERQLTICMKTSRRFGVVCGLVTTLCLALIVRVQAQSSPVGLLELSSGSATDTIEFLPMVENRAPTLHLLEPSAGSSYRAADSIPIRVEALDPDGYVPHLEYFVDGQKFDEVTINFLVAPPPGQSQSFASKWSQPTVGAHKISVVATDNLGAKADASVTITITSDGANNQRPRVTLLEPKEGAQYAVGDTVALVVEAVDSDGYIPHIEYWIDGQKIGEETLHFLVQPPPGRVQQFKWPWRNATAGTHRVKVVVADDRNETADASVEVFVGTEAKLPLVSITATRPETTEPCPVCRIAPGEFTLSRTGDLKATLTVLVRYSGSALPGVDYVELPSRVEFPAGQSTVVLDFGALEDQLVDGDETVVATLQESLPGQIPSYRIDPSLGVAKGVIHDQLLGLTPIVGVTATQPNTAEPCLTCRIAPGVFTITRTGPTFNALSLPLSYGGTATPGVDYEKLPTDIEIPIGQVSIELRVFARFDPLTEGGELGSLGDCVIEGTETVVLKILPDSSAGPIGRYRIADGHGTAEIAIHDSNPPNADTTAVVSIKGGTSAPEHCPPGVNCFMINFLLTRRGGDLNQPLSVQLKYGGTATPGLDYPKLPETVNFGAGESTASISARPLDDLLVEGDETVVATLRCSNDAHSDYRIEGQAASAISTIIDNDQPHGKAFVSVTAPKDGAIFTDPVMIDFVARTGDPLGAITSLDWYADVEKIGESFLEFFRAPDPGTELTHSFSWKNPPAGEHKIYAVGLDAMGTKVVSPAILVRVVRGQTRSVVTVTADRPETREVPPGSKIALVPGTFVLRRTGDISHSLKVYYTIGGTATNGRDYEFLDGDANFAAGEKERVIFVSPITDLLVEGDETVDLKLSPRDSYSLGESAFASVVIHDAQQPTEPVVRFLEPADGLQMEAGLDLKLIVNTIDPVGYFGIVDFYANEQLIGSDVLIICLSLACQPHPGTPFQYRTVWTHVPAGKYTLVAVGQTIGGQRVKSLPIHILVGSDGTRSFVSRTLPKVYHPGASVEVTLHATPPTPSKGGSYGVEDHPPKGWVVGDISDGGVWDALHGAVKFGPFLDDLERALHYTVGPPSGAGGVGEFRGVGSLNGDTTPIIGSSSILPELEQHPADRDPANWSLSLSEITAYGAAWKRGDLWPIGPNPIPIDYVTRAGALWRGGEGYAQNLMAGPAPLWWVNLSDSVLPPSGLDFDLPPAEVGDQLQMIRARRSFAFAEVLGDSADGWTVHVTTLPGEGVRSQAVEGILSAGEQVGEISDNGQFDAAQGIVRWGPFADALPHTLSLRLKSGVGTGFSGSASFDGEGFRLGVPGAPEAKGEVGKPRIAGVRRLLDGTMQLLVVADSSGGCDVEYTDDALTWHRIGEMTPGAACQIYQDTDANESPLRLYRAVRRP